MEKFKIFFQDKIYIIIIVMFGLLFMNNCSHNSNIKSLKKEFTQEIDSLTQELNDINARQSHFITTDEMEKIQNETMFRFLMYEEDIDKGRTSFSKIRIELKKLENNVEE